MPIKAKGQFFEIPQSKLDELNAEHSGVDVLNELRKMYRWCRDNPRKRKTSSGMPRFINNWLNTAESEQRQALTNGGKSPKFQTVGEQLKQAGEAVKHIEFDDNEVF